MFNLCIPYGGHDGFCGRVEELRYLNSVYQKVPVSCAVCGRRHLGKTTLIKQFCKDKNHIYLSGMDGLREDNLAEISHAISEYSGKGVIIDDIEDLFPMLKKICAKKPVVVVIDHYSDLVENFPQVQSYLRAFMNRTSTPRDDADRLRTDNSLFGRFYYTLDVKQTYRTHWIHPHLSRYKQLMATAHRGRGIPQDVKGDPWRSSAGQFFGSYVRLLSRVEAW